MDVPIDPERVMHYDQADLDDAVLVSSNGDAEVHCFMDQIEPEDDILWRPYVVAVVGYDRRMPETCAEAFDTQREATRWTDGWARGFYAGLELR